MTDSAQNRKVVVFGSSTLANEWFHKIQETGNIVACIDNDPKKHGTQWNEITINSIDHLKDIEYDQLVIASSYRYEILETLVHANKADDRISYIHIKNGVGSPLPLTQALDLPRFPSDILPTYLPKAKILNRIHALQEASHRNPHPKSLPSELIVDPTNLCNLKCPLCPTGQRAPGLAKGQLTADSFKKIIEQLRENLAVVWLQNWGEPTLHKDLASLIKIADENQVYTYLASNLNQFNPSIETAILNSGLKHIKVEIDGAHQSSYEQFRGNGNLSNVLKNLRLIAELKRQSGQQYPIITAACLVSKFNEHEIEQIATLAHENGAENVEFFRITLDSRKPELIKTWAPKDSKYALDIAPPDARYFCSDPWKMISINHQGNAQPCCRIYDDRVKFGNILKTSIKELWTNEHFTSARISLATSGKQAGPRKTICELCRGNLNSDQLEQVAGTLAIRLPDDLANEYSSAADSPTP